MPNIAEPDPHRSGPIERAGCDSAALVLLHAARTTRTARVEARAAANGEHSDGRVPSPPRVALETALRATWRTAKRLMPDTLFLALSHWRRVGRIPRLAAPQTFNEFILQRCRNPEPHWTLLADKLAVREFVKERIGEEHLIELIATPDVFDRAVFDALPTAFVMKAKRIVDRPGRGDHQQVLRRQVLAKTAFAQLGGFVFEDERAGGGEFLQKIIAAQVEGKHLPPDRSAGFEIVDDLQLVGRPRQGRQRGIAELHL